MTTTYQDHRVTGRDAIEVVAQRQALLLQLSFVPVAVGDDHVAGIGHLSSGRDGGRHVGERSRARQVDPRTSAGAMQVVVHQARQQRLSLEIDQPSRRSGNRPHLRAGPHCHHPIAVNSDRFSKRKPRIDSDHLGVVEHQ